MVLAFRDALLRVRVPNIFLAFERNFAALALLLDRVPVGSEYVSNFAPHTLSVQDCLRARGHAPVFLGAPERLASLVLFCAGRALEGVQLQRQVLGTFVHAGVGARVKVYLLPRE